MSSLDFALIGHMESWSDASAVLGQLRGPSCDPLPEEDLRSIVEWLPPRTICRVTAHSTSGANARGVYIDAFIPPDRLDSRFLRENLGRVIAAAECAKREGAALATLGGFSSILLEGRLDLLPEGISFTTGNTLTVALIVRGIERALSLCGRDLRHASLLIVGATGDIGSACARWFATRVGRLILCGRNRSRLTALERELESQCRVERGTDLRELAARADLVICAAALPGPELLLDSLPASAIVCDAGYPKNVFASAGAIVFFGGLGVVSGGLAMRPDLEGTLNRHPYPHVAHGCLLEGMTLALERRFEAFSRGRGQITPGRVDEIWEIAQRHGIELAPLFNHAGPVESEIVELRERSQS